MIVCVNRRANPDLPSCGERGGTEIAQALEAAIAARNLPVMLERFYCLGCCERGPNLKFSSGGEFWHDAHLEDVPALLDRIAAFVHDA